MGAEELRGSRRERATLEDLGLGPRGRAPGARRRSGGSSSSTTSASASPTAPAARRRESRRSACAAPARAASGGSPTVARPTLTSACCTPTASRFRMPFARSCGTSTKPRMWSRDRAPRTDVIAILDWAGDAGAAVIPFGGGSSVVGGVDPAVGRRLRRHDQPRSQGARSGPRDRPRQPRRAHPGRHPWPRPRGRLEAARSHAPAFSAELRVLDARRLDRDPLGRPFRDALHPHRRLRRKPARGDARGVLRAGACPGPAPGRARIVW